MVSCVSLGSVLCVFHVCRRITVSSPVRTSSIHETRRSFGLSCWPTATHCQIEQPETVRSRAGMACTQQLSRTMTLRGNGECLRLERGAKCLTDLRFEQCGEID